MAIHVFLGPSLNLDAARAILPDATYHPPVRYGDVLRLVGQQSGNLPDAIAVVDGYFHQTAAVWHKEILCALSNGVPVYGASSMGALRAAELCSFGMRPIGRIAQAYIEQEFPPFTDAFDGDDEVAVQHGPAEIGYPSTLALVDCRWRLAQAIDDGAVVLREAQAVIDRLKRVYYPERTEERFMDAVLELCESPEAYATLMGQDRSLKEADARTLLQELANSTPISTAPIFRFELTQNWSIMFDAILGEGAHNHDD